jgi:hypothetical protein
VSDETPDNVITVAFGRETEVKERDRLHCRHHSYKLDTEDRTVNCGACGAGLDAFDTLLEYANKERRWHHWDKEQRETQARLNELKEEEKRVKARTRAASRKDAATAVAEEKRKEGLRKKAIADLAREMKKTCERIERLTQGGQVHDPGEGR